jgi:rhamnogalacturonyl hydrolase YesR
MAPPFLTYYAVATNNKTLLKYTVAEIGRQRQILQLGGTTPYKGLWQHIVGPRAQSLGLWSTGNAWVLLGLVRVLATIQHWPNTAQWTENTAILRGYIYEILDGVVASKSNLDPANGLIRNYIVGGLNSYSDTSYKWFGEAAGTAGIAAAIYRMAVLDPGKGKNYVAFADSLRKAVAKTVGKDGVLRPVVNPYDWTDKNPSRTGSPEAQAFAGMLGASYLDYLGSKSS